MFAMHRSQARAYSTIHVETGVASADPHRLVELLIDGALEALAEAVVALQRRDLPAKGRAITRAVSIIDEGLRGGLDRERGGAVAAQLDTLYTCVTHRLTQANLKNDLALLNECRGLLMPLREAWQAIRPQAVAA